MDGVRVRRADDEAMSAGAIDFGWAGDTPAIFAQSAGAKFVYTACMPASAHGLLVAEGSAIRSLADIKGKKIAFARGTSAHLVTLRLLAKAGLTYNDIVPVYLPPADGAKALVGGSVDAWVVWDPFLALAQSRQKVRVIATTKDIVNGNSVYVANPDFAAKHPRALAAVMEEVKRVTEWAAQNRDQFAEKLASRRRSSLSCRKPPTRSRSSGSFPSPSTFAALCGRRPATDPQQDKSVCL